MSYHMPLKPMLGLLRKFGKNALLIKHQIFLHMIALVDHMVFSLAWFLNKAAYFVEILSNQLGISTKQV